MQELKWFKRLVSLKGAVIVDSKAGLDRGGRDDAFPPRGAEGRSKVNWEVNEDFRLELKCQEKKTGHCYFGR